MTSVQHRLYEASGTPIGPSSPLLTWPMPEDEEGYAHDQEDQQEVEPGVMRGNSEDHLTSLRGLVDGQKCKFFSLRSARTEIGSDSSFACGRGMVAWSTIASANH